MKQKLVKESKAKYGISKYTKDQYNLHTDIMNLLKSKKYKKIPADKCVIVFARIYSTYALSQLIKQKKIKWVKK